MSESGHLWMASKANDAAADRRSLQFDEVGYF